ncbi:flagellar hook-length control protein FliK [Lysobacter soli]|uniref:flagellar hook-length control protein FliK n=1 Tax=Lysobacter soli TaxID=453783 RepID=UPI00240F397A|nr:flagellar hook-length control protein FliK [Lysobacter soli]MDG2519786.1 flagellar hook-length control protein FliK [Lysobacter soli]
MQAFDALFGGQRANSARNTTPDTSRSSNVQDDAGASGGFDRMLQAQGSRNVATNPASRMNESPNASTQAKAKEPATRDAESPRASEESKASEAKSNETKSNDASRETARAESKDGESNDGGSGFDTAATASEDAMAASDTTSTAATTASGDATAPALPEQMLALLNGLAGAGTGAAATSFAVAPEAQPPGLLRDVAVATASDPRGGNATAPVLPTLPGAPAATAAPTDGDATAAFAMAMGAAASADTKSPGATDTAALDSIGIGDTASTSASLPPVSTMTNHPLPRGVAAAAQANTPIPLDNGFDDGFSSRIAWLADQKIGHAEIRITPDHLGAIDVRLQLDGNRVNAEFHSAQPDVRHALESSLPRLKEMLGQQGLQLGQADVGQRQAQQQSNGQAASFGGSNERGEPADDAGWSRGPAVRASRGLLDEYA